MILRTVASHLNFPLYKECSMNSHIASLPDQRNQEKDSIQYRITYVYMVYSIHIYI